jgi:hypothetical protein
MTEKSSRLGKLVSVHGMSPTYLQRALIVIILSFLFFLMMLLAFSIRQNVGYFILATAFLVVKVVMLFGWMSQRKKELRLYENGFAVRKHVCLFDEIADFRYAQRGSLFGADKFDVTVTTLSGEKITFSDAFDRVQFIIDYIDSKMSASDETVEGESTSD